MTLTPDDVFGISIFAFFVLAVLAFIYITWQFFTKSESRNKAGEKAIMWASLVGVILVVAYAVMAFLFKIII